MQSYELNHATATHPVSGVLEAHADFRLSLGCGGAKHRLNTENVNETGGACWEHKDQFSAQSQRGWCDSGGQSLHANNNAA